MISKIEAVNTHFRDLKLWYCVSRIDLTTNTHILISVRIAITPPGCIAEARGVVTEDLLTYTANVPMANNGLKNDPVERLGLSYRTAERLAQPTCNLRVGVKRS